MYDARVCIMYKRVNTILNQVKVIFGIPVCNLCAKANAKESTNRKFI